MRRDERAVKTIAEPNMEARRAMADDTDMKPHVETYHSVLGVMKYGAVACLLIGLFVVWLISGAK